MSLVGKIVQQDEKHWFTDKEVLGTAVRNKDYADRLLDHEKTHYLIFLKKVWIVLPIGNALEKIHFIYWMTLVVSFFYIEALDLEIIGEVGNLSQE